MGANQKIGRKLKLYFGGFAYFRLKYGKDKSWFSFRFGLFSLGCGLDFFKLSQFEYLFKLKVF